MGMGGMRGEEDWGGDVGGEEMGMKRGEDRMRCLVYVRVLATGPLGLPGWAGFTEAVEL